MKLEKLEMRGGFTRRHIGPDRHQIREMATYLGLDDLEQIVDKAVPESIISEQPLALTRTISEREVGVRLRRMRRRNRVFTSMIGMGYHDTIMPAVIKRNVLENPAWYTAYTPYQAEISQGRLEALLNFQQMITDLTGMEIANASMLDEATAAAEAMSMAKRVSKKDSRLFFVDRDCHPQTISVVRTRAHWFGYEVHAGDPLSDLADRDVFGALFQYPGSSGEVTNLRGPIEQAHGQGAIVSVAADILALVLLTPPGEMDADIVVGNTQRFGMPMGYGGPHAAYFASREKFVRSMPGRLIGVSIDNRGDRALRMALQTREQHIRRDKATSNICTSQVLPAVIAGFYAIYYGPAELRLIAERVHRLTQVLAAGLQQLGYRVVSSRYFDTIKVCVPSRARRLAAKAREAQINLRVYDADYLGIAFDETTTRAELTAVWKVFASDAEQRLDIDELDRGLKECIPAQLFRSSAILQHPVFELYHSETEMMRYLKRLEEAERRDHRTLGRQLGLYSIHEEIGPGLIVWHPKGGVVRTLVEDYWRDIHYRHDYNIVYSPHIGRAQLWQTSGHLDHYRESMYAPLEVDEQEYFLKPMNCPFHIMVYRSTLRSYRELPLRIAELGTVYRYERSGVLHGLMRVRGFTQDDAHIFCLPEQVEDEVGGVLDLTFELLDAFGFSDYSIFLSTRPDSYAGELEMWDHATDSLRRALEQRSLAFDIDEGGGAFYGPKVDIKIQDALGREWQCTTVQFDFNLPERFDLTFMDPEGGRSRPYMVHRAILGSLERFLGVLIEHYAGAFPLWLAPVQATVIPIADRHLEYAESVKGQLESQGFRAEVDSRSERMNLKIRNAQLQKVPYMLVVGDREQEDGAVAVRTREGGNLGAMALDDLLARLAEEAKAQGLGSTGR